MKEVTTTKFYCANNLGHVVDTDYHNLPKATKDYFFIYYYLRKLCYLTSYGLLLAATLTFGLAVEGTRSVDEAWSLSESPELYLCIVLVYLSPVFKWLLPGAVFYFTSVLHNRALSKQ